MSKKVNEGMGGDAIEVSDGGVVQVKSGGRVYLESGGQLVVADGGLLMLDEGAIVKRSGVNDPASVTFTPAAGSANVSEVTFTVVDADGVAIAGVFNMDIWLSDAATGAGLTTTTASGAVAAKASSGVDLVTLVSKKALRVQTKADGTYILSITDSAKTAFLPCAQVPGTGKTSVGAALITGNYG